MTKVVAAYERANGTTVLIYEDGSARVILVPPIPAAPPVADAPEPTTTQEQA